MDCDLIAKYITIPMAIKVLRQDRQTFESFKFYNVYQDKLDSVLEKLQSDFFAIKKELVTKYNLDVRFLGNKNELVQYKFNNELITYTPKELRLMTGLIMRDYLYGKNATHFELKEHIK